MLRNVCAVGSAMSSLIILPVWIKAALAGEEDPLCN
jgi:hypothetical protein